MPATAVASPADRITKRQQYETLRAALWTERASFDGLWSDLGRMFFPVRPRFQTTDRNRGDRRNQQIIDNTATMASNTLRSGLHAGLTSPARPWFKLSVPDPGLAKFGPVKQWLYDVTERMHVVFQLSNLYNALPLIYGDMGIFGTAAMGVLDDFGAAGQPGDLFRCYPYPIGSYALGMDNRGLATTFVREYAKTVGQLVAEFGGADGEPLPARATPDWSRFSPTVKTLWDRGQYESVVNVCWIVKPNREADERYLDARAFPWTSCHFEKGRSTVESGDVLRESGFQEFPILAPRWFANAEDTYGTDCPGLVAMGDARQLQSQQKTKGKALVKLVDPPLVGPMHLRTQKVSLLPGDVTYSDDRESMRGLRPIHEVRPDVQHLVLDIEMTQGRINRAFFVDLFRMLSSDTSERGTQPPTAREVEELHEEKLIALGPVLESTGDELLDPLIDRVYAQMERAGMIPPAPADLNGVVLRPEYTSILAQAQKLLRVTAQDRLVQSVGGIATFYPDAIHKLDVWQVIDDYQDMLGTNPAQIRSNDAAQTLQQAQRQALEAQANAETTLQTAKSAQALGQTPLGGDTALTRILAGAATQAQGVTP